MKRRQKIAEGFKQALYFEAIHEKLSGLLTDYDYALVSDAELATALTLRDVPCTRQTISRVRRLYGIPNRYERLKQHMQQAKECQCATVPSDSANSIPQITLVEELRSCPILYPRPGLHSPP